MPFPTHGRWHWFRGMWVEGTELAPHVRRQGVVRASAMCKSSLAPHLPRSLRACHFPRLLLLECRARATSPRTMAFGRGRIIARGSVGKLLSGGLTLILPGRDVYARRDPAPQTWSMR